MRREKGTENTESSFDVISAQLEKLDGRAT